MSSVWSALTGGVVGVGVGEAAGVALDPVFEPLKQDAWKKSQAKLLELDELAALVAQSLLSLGDVTDDAERQGYAVDQLKAAVQLALKAPPLPEALELWRRGRITEDQVKHALAKAQIEADYQAAYLDLFVGRLGPEVVATAIQRGLLANESSLNPGVPILPVGPPTTVGLVPPMPMVDLDPGIEAQAHGDNWDRLAVRARIIGLPPAAGELLQLLNRGVIEDVDYYRGIAEGNTRNEWAKFLIELRRRLLTPHEYAELRLRGWIDDSTMLAGAALSGMEDADTRLLFELLGRPIPVHQVTTGLARGGTFDGPIDQIPEAYIRSLEEGNQRPEWYNLSFANRYSLPSPFVIRALLKDGAYSAAIGEQRLLESGWIPADAKLVAEHYAATTGAGTKTVTAAQLIVGYEAGRIPRAELLTALQGQGYSPAGAEAYVQHLDDKPVAAAHGRTITRLHELYIKGELTTDQVKTELAATPLAQSAQNGVLAAWEHEARIVALAGSSGPTGAP